MPTNGIEDLIKLYRQSASIIGLAILGTDRLDPRSQLSISIGGYIGEQMVFDLMAEITAQQMKELAAGYITGTSNLPNVPLAGLIFVAGTGRE